MGQSIRNPFPTFHDNNGELLENGYIYIGVAGLNPESNPINIFWDKDAIYPAAQPLRTINGLPSRSGTPSAIFTSSSDYSILVKNKNEELIFSALNISEIGNNYSTVAIMKTASVDVGQTLTTQGYYAAGDNGGATYLVVAPQTFDGYGDHELANGNIAVLQHNGILYSEWFGIKEAPFDSQPALQSIADNWTTLAASTLIIGSTLDDIEISYRITFDADDVAIQVSCGITCTYTTSNGRGSGVFCFSKTGEVDWNDAVPGQALLDYGGVRQKNVSVKSMNGRQTLDGGGSGVIGFVWSTTNNIQLDTISFNNSEDCFLEGFNLTNGLNTNLTKFTSRHITTKDCIGTDPVEDNNFTASYDAGVVTAAKTIDRDLMAEHTFLNCKSYRGAFGYTALKARAVLFEDCISYDDEVGFGAEEIGGHVVGDLDYITFKNTEAIGSTERPYQITSDGIRMINPVSKDCVKVITLPDSVDVNLGNGIHMSACGDIMIFNPIISGMPNKGINIRNMTGDVKIFNPVIDDVAYDSINCVNSILRVDIHDLVGTNAGRNQIRVKGDVSDRTANVNLYSCDGNGDYQVEEFGFFRAYDSRITDGQANIFNGGTAELHSPSDVVTQGEDLTTRGINIQATVDVGKIFDPKIDQGSFEHIINEAATRYGYVNDEEELIGSGVAGDAAVRPKMNLTGASAAVTGNFPLFSIIWNTNIAGGQPMGWRVTGAGTNKTLSAAVTVNATTISGDTFIIVDTVENITKGNYITIAGESDRYRVLHVDSVNLKIYLDDNLTGDRDGSAVTFTTLTSLALPNN